MNSSFSIRGLNADDIDLIDATDGGAAWHACAELWTTYLDEQRAGARIVRLALSGSKIVGYGSLLFVSGYSRFTDQGIPEINNLVVAEGFRGRGIGSAIISDLQTEARNRNFDQIGLGVGLYSDMDQRSASTSTWDTFQTATARPTETNQRRRARSIPSTTSCSSG